MAVLIGGIKGAWGAKDRLRNNRFAKIRSILQLIAQLVFLCRAHQRQRRQAHGIKGEQRVRHRFKGGTQRLRADIRHLNGNAFGFWGFCCRGASRERPVYRADPQREAPLRLSPPSLRAV